MTSVWVLMVFFMPVGDGLVMGWSASYPTEQECQVARRQALQQSGRGTQSIVISPPCSTQVRK